MSKKKQSISQWEDSFFGGYKKILYDYPEIKAPYQIDTKVPDNELSWYSSEKLMKLFQMKLGEFKLVDRFLANAKLKVKKNWIGTKKNYLVPTKASISDCVNSIIDLDSELSNLFDHYKDLIESTEFMYPYDKEEPKDGEKGEGKGDKNDEKGEGKGDGKSKGEDTDDGEGNDGEGDEGKGNPAEMSTAKNAAKNLISEVIKRPPYGMGSCVSGDLKAKVKWELMTSSLKPVIYTKEEEKEANRLISMLDISFDPAVDKVGNLKNGKIDTGKIASVPAGNHHIYYTIEEHQTTKPFSVCILCDESGSMQMGSRVNPQHHTVKVLYRAFSQIIPLDKIYVYGHAGSSFPVIRIYHDKFNPVFDYTIEQQLANRYEENYDGPVIECIYEKIREGTDDNIIFISLSDGQPCGHNYGGNEAIKDLKRVIEKCKRDGFVTAGVGLEFGMIKEIYNYNTIIGDMSKMTSKVSLLVNQLVKTEFQA